MSTEEKRERRAALAAVKQDRKDFENGLRQCLSTREGRWFIWDLLGRTGLFHDAFTDEPTRMAYIVGQQSIGKQMLAEIGEVRPEAWLQMTKENQEKQNARARPEPEPES